MSHHRVLSFASRTLLMLGLMATLLPSNAAAQKVVKIGVAGPYSGPVAAYGRDFESAVRMAVDEANASGIRLNGQAIRFELVSQDDAADPKQAVQVANLLVDQGVVGVVGHLTSGTSVPAARIYRDAEIPQIAPAATSPTLTRQGYKTAFRVIGDDQQVGSAVARYIVATLGLKSVAVIDDRTSFGQGLADVVAKAVPNLGGSISAREFTTDKASDFRAVLTIIKSKKVDAVFFGGVNAQAAPLRRQMRELGITAPLFGSSIASGEFLSIAGMDAAEGTFSADSGQPLEKMAGAASFVERFGKKYGKVLMYAPYGYDAANVLIGAMKAADSSDPKVFLASVQKLKFQGVTGPIAFDEKGDLKSALVTISSVVGGKWVPLETVNSR